MFKGQGLRQPVCWGENTNNLNIGAFEISVDKQVNVYEHVFYAQIVYIHVSGLRLASQTKSPCKTCIILILVIFGL